VPLPGTLRLQALTAINSILHPPPVPTTPTSPTVTATPPTTFSTTDTGSFNSTDTPTDSSSTDGGASTAPATATAVADPAVLRAVHTSWFSAGAIRWMLPLFLLVGLGAALGALLLGRIGRRTPIPATVDGPPGPMEEP
jgi:hypothetical protein